MSTVNYSHNESPFLTNVRLIESDMEIEEVSRQVFIWRDKVVSLIKPSLRRSEKLDVLKDLLHVQFRVNLFLFLNSYLFIYVYFIFLIQIRLRDLLI
jgi:hypothetical protein